MTACALALALSAAAADQAVHKITSPKEALGFNIGDDYRLATYTQLTDWWKKLAAESDRMKLVEIGEPKNEGRSSWRNWPIREPAGSPTAIHLKIYLDCGPHF